MRRNAESIRALSQGRWLLAAAWGALALGVLFRLLAVGRMDVWEDGVEYVAMGHAWSRAHEFFLLDSERFGRSVLFGPGYSHHFPPAFPFTLGLIFSAIGFGALQAKAAMLTVSLAALGVVYATTRDLYGRDSAALVAGLLALDPSLVWVTGIGLSDNFSLLFATLTVWAFLRSLEQPRYLLPAGMFWTVVYLSRSSAGAFGALPVPAAAWWWWRFRGWRALLSPWCIGAGLVFVGAAGLWGWRNHTLFGDWATSSYYSEAFPYAEAHLGRLAEALVGKGAFFLCLFVAYALPFAPELRASLRRLREADTSILWLFVAVVWGLAWLVSAALWPYETRPFFSFDQHRYILIGVVPLLWIAVREAGASGRLGLRWAGLAALLSIISVGVLLFPIRLSSARAAEFLDPYLRDGDTVAIGGSISKYDLDLHLSRIDRIGVYTRPPRTPDFVFLGDKAPEPMPAGWDLVGRFEVRGAIPSVTYVIAPSRLIRERGLPTVTQSFP